MITEQYVSFETSKMLKEAGFDEDIRSWLVKEDGDNWCAILDGCKRDVSIYLDALACPTQALAARWLRKVHGIVVDVVFEPPKLGKDWRYFIGNMDDMAWVGDFVSSDGRYDTYEEAMEDALQEALRLIIKK